MVPKPPSPENGFQKPFYYLLGVIITVLQVLAVSITGWAAMELREIKQVVNTLAVEVRLNTERTIVNARILNEHRDADRHEGALSKDDFVEFRKWLQEELRRQRD